VQLGTIVSEDPEEEKAQRKLKGLLNKLTVDNFEKVLPQMVEPIVSSGRAKTLQGFINQIFDKALTETTFAELYAKLVAE
jgi:translation initiation factor 4G